MDANQFDSLTKTLISRPTRRAVLTWLSGGALGGSLTWLGLAEARARKRNKNNRRKKPRDCPVPNEVCGNSCCTIDRTCCRGECYGPCPEGKTRDPRTCRCKDCPPTRIPCGNACCLPPGQECCRGLCRPACAAGETRDPETCQCICPGASRAGRELSAAAACCPPCPEGYTPDPQTCECVCDRPCGTSCCPSDHTCCPLLGGDPVCRRQSGSCDVCSFPCGDQCCDYGSFNSCCRDSNGTFRCSTAGGSC